MHLSKEVIGKTSVVVEPGEVGAAYIAYLKFLVARWAGCVGQSFEFSFAIFLHLLELSDLEEFRDGRVDTA